MVTTRRGARNSAPRDREDNSSSDDASIPARTPPVQRRQPASRTPATLRPSRELAPRNANPPKRKRGPSGTPNGPQQKRRRVASDAADTIEVQGEDDNVDAAINATSARSAYRLEIHLPSVRRPERNDEANSAEVAPGPSTTGVPARRLRARRLKRGINSVEIFGAFGSPSPRKSKRVPAAPHIIDERPEPDSNTGPTGQRNYVAGNVVEGSTGAETPRSGGSPELQSSAVRIRSTRPRVDAYDILDDDDVDPPNPVRGIGTRNNLEIWNRDKSDKRQTRHPRSPERNDRTQLIREARSEPATRGPRRPEPHQPTRSGDASRLSDEGDRELVIYGNRRQVNQTVDRELERRQAREQTEQTDETDETDETVSETDESESDEEAGQRKMKAIQVRPCSNDEDTIPVYSDHLQSISKLMGRSGWTGAGRRWMAELDAHMPEFGVHSRVRTRLGKRIFKSLTYLKDELDEVPNAMDLAEQYQYLAGHQLILNDAISEIDKEVRKVERLRNTNQLRKRMVNDFSKCIMPMLVLVMQTSFAVGVQQPDAVVDDSLSSEGVFTWTTVQYLLGTLGWLSRLQTCLNLPPGGSPEDRAGQQYDYEDPKQNREKLAVIVRKFIQQIRHQVDSFNARADANRELYEERRRIKQMKERDRIIREQNEREEEKELALARREEERFWLSLQQVTDQSRPRPLAEKFRKATSHWTRPAQISQPRPQSSDPNTWTLSHRGSQSLSVDASMRPPPPSAGQRAPQSRPAPPSPELGHPPWDEGETAWLLGELRRPDRERDYLDVWAETLERTPQEIMAEKRRLERTGEYRSPTRQR